MLRKFLAVMFLVSSCSAQDVYSVARQAGATVYDKVVAAQALCSGPCTIVFDSFLPKIAGEVLPEKCVNCTWLDYRVAIPVGTGPGTLSAGDDARWINVGQGPKGDPGDPGTPGTPGTPGAAATIAVGTVATGAAGSAATVTNSGTSSAAIFDFSIPKGDQGDQGIQGTQGPKGDPGTPASISSSMAQLSADVTMTTAGTAYDGPSLANLAAGTYFFDASVTVASANATAQRVSCKLWNGTATYASAEHASPSQGTSTKGYVDISTTAVVTLATTTTVKVTCTSSAASSVIKAATGDYGAGNNASTLVALKIG